MKRAVFLDRDGVLNRAIVHDGKPYPPSNVSELEILPGVEEALAALRKAGFLLIVVTNQPDVTRGTTTRDAVEAINAALGRELPIDEFRTCYHDSEAGCDCRKPRPGALLAAAAHHDIDLCDSFMVGDRWRDTEAGQRAGCRTILVDYGYQEKRPEAVDYSVASLSEAAEIILRRHCS
jgi:D-glycero-D-manno-heptose 1,7-bisphosphate phosphatase